MSMRQEPKKQKEVVKEVEKQDKLGLIQKHSEKLEELRKMRQTLGKDLYEGLEKTEELYKKINKDTQRKETSVGKST